MSDNAIRQDDSAPKLLQLTAENVKRIQAVTIEIKGDTTVIAGNNGQGKSSTIDSIWYALGGTGCHPGKVIRDGQDRASVELKFDQFTVRREWSERGSKLIVTAANGKQITSPQQLLNGLFGGLGFDPMEFMVSKPKDMAETLRRIANIDTTELDNQRAAKYDERTNINRDLRRIDGSLQTAKMQVPDNAPTERVDTRLLAKELSEAETHNKALEEKSRSLLDEKQKADQLIAKIKDLNEQLHACRDNIVQLETEREGQSLIDTDAIRSKLSNASDINAVVELVTSVRNYESQLATAKERESQLTQEIQDIDDKKQKLLADAKFPVDGLSVDGDRVLFNGIPLDQASTAEQVRVCLGMAFAMNPKGKLALIRNASLLDQNAMQLVANIAKEFGGHVFLERVGNEPNAIVIEDGQVVSRPE